MNDPNPFASPEATDGAYMSAGEFGAAGALAGRFTRLSAAILDGIILMIAVLPLGYLLSVGFFDPTIWNPPTNSNPFLPQFDPVTVAINFVVGLVMFLAVNGYLLANNGQTVGKWLLGIKIVRKDGSPADFGRLVGLRYVLMWIIGSVPYIGGLFWIVDSLLIFRHSRYCLHDDIADTVVVKV